MKKLSSTKTKILLSTLILGLTACSSQAPQNVLNAKDKSGVIGGEAVEELEVLAKSTVYLQTFLLDNKGETIGGSSCTGTLIAENLIITAAHCVPESGVTNYRMAVAFKRDLEKILQEDVRFVKQHIAHPSYGQALLAQTQGSSEKSEGPKPEEGMFDIALVSFEGSIPAGYAPANILKDNLKLQENLAVTVSGFGLTKWEGDIQEGTTILRKGPAIFLGFANPYEAILDQSQNQLGGGACSGDSGGPVTAVIDNVEYVWGVASRVGNRSDRLKPCNDLSIYTSIASHQRFVTLASEFLIKDLAEGQLIPPAVDTVASK